MQLEWNVYRINNSKNKVEIFNVFNHQRFKEEVIRCLKTCDSKDAFSTLLSHSVFYYFGWKYEYEICITSLFSHREETEEKIDICHQLELNWSKFVDYIWSNKEGILND